MTPYITTLEHDRQDTDAAIDLTAEEQLAEVVPAYLALPPGPTRDRFYADCSDAAQAAIDRERAAIRAALLGGIAASGRGAARTTERAA
jgi:hypothetical protein